MITVYNKNEIYRNCYDILIYAYDWRRAEIKLDKEPVGNLSELIATCNSNLFGIRQKYFMLRRKQKKTKQN